LASMFAKQQAVIALNEATDAYNAQLQNGKEMGLEEEVPELEIFNYKLLAQYNFFALSVKRRAALSGV